MAKNPAMMSISTTQSGQVITGMSALAHPAAHDRRSFSYKPRNELLDLGQLEGRTPRVIYLKPNRKLTKMRQRLSDLKPVDDGERIVSLVLIPLAEGGE